MSKCIIQPVNNKLSGEINSSASKSQSLRAILFASLADGTSTICNLLNSPDVDAMIAACEQFGAEINFINSNTITVVGTSGDLKPTYDVINAGNSGIVLRFIASISVLLDSYTVITGDYSIRTNRPIKSLLDGLNRLGVFAESLSGNNKAPIIVKGPVLFNETSLDGQDSQPVSGLIIAATQLKNNTIINVDNPGEKPWIDLTLNWLDFLNIDYTREGYSKYIIHGKHKINAFEYFVPADLSSIAFPIAAALVTNSEIKINNVDLSDPQGDKILLDIFNQMGANIVYDKNNKQIIVHKHNGLSAVDVNINNCIDAINILAVVACYANGTTNITGARIARFKECDRIACITKELTKMRANIQEFDDGLSITGSKLYCSNELHSYNDHRMVMALYVASIAANKSIFSESVIHNIESVNKSYPGFFNDINMLT